MLMALLSCRNDSRKSFLDLFNDSIVAKTNLIDEFPIDSLGNPVAIMSIRNCVLFSEPKLSHLMMSYDLKRKSITRFLPKGQGIKEAIDIQTLGKGPYPNSIYALDVLSQSIFLFSLKGDKIQILGKDSIMPDAQFASVAYDRDLVFFLTIGTPNRFSLRLGDHFMNVGENLCIANIPSEVVSRTLQGPCCLSSKRKRIVWFSIYGDAMEIYDYSNLNKIKVITSKLISPPVFDMAGGRNNGALDRKTKLSVASVTSDDDYIYALYNGHVLEDAVGSRDDILLSNKLLVFDWEGTPCMAIKLDRPIKSITYDKKEHLILALGLNEKKDFALYSFPIKKYIQ